MIAVDTSALMAIIKREPEADACIAILEAEDVVYISAGTVAEASAASAWKCQSCSTALASMSFRLRRPRHIGSQWHNDRWGKGVDPAGLNFGDCFAYEVAQQQSCKLLYVGNDFGKTDIVGALPVRPGFSPE
jgi:ribonuclease VapC